MNEKDEKRAKRLGRIAGLIAIQRKHVDDLGGELAVQRELLSLLYAERERLATFVDAVPPKEAVSTDD